jgi:hypothetical protein
MADPERHLFLYRSSQQPWQPFAKEQGKPPAAVKSLCSTVDEMEINTM